MRTETAHYNIEVAIKTYADGYRALQTLQDGESGKASEQRLLPQGDQKTGVAGEYWALRYARILWPQVEIHLGEINEKGWDLDVKNGADIFRIQVKAASLFSEKRCLSPIHPPSEHWHELWMILLDVELAPVGFWTIDATEFSKSRSGSRFIKKATLTKKLHQVHLPKDHTGPISPAWLNAGAANNTAKFRSALGLQPLP